VIPVELDEVASEKRPCGVAQIDHRGNAYSRATTAPCERAAPTSLANPQMVAKAGVHPTSMTGTIRISSG
jgi:hypothetical protein